MAQHDHAFSEEQGISRPPLFTGSDYNYWKTRMRCFLISLDIEVWNMIEPNYTHPTYTVGDVVMEKPKDKWDDQDKLRCKNNAKVMNVLFCALDRTEFNRTCACNNAYEIWNLLEVTHEGTSQVKDSKLFQLESEFEKFRMEVDEDHKGKKKVLKAETWDDTTSEDASSSSTSEEEANMRLMGKSVIYDDECSVQSDTEVCWQAKDKEDVWYLDSGCSKHMTGNKEKFFSLEMKKGGVVTFGDNGKGKIIGIGVDNTENRYRRAVSLPLAITVTADVGHDPDVAAHEVTSQRYRGAISLSSRDSPRSSRSPLRS
ncbi:hypothetical protein KSP39_PZI008049 [Platanthera zijinensis]|uniref:Retrovirus-related Pol polyprotein from transposon TNT 1-94-like beta-barrel domain-containing protein n=1 Tax=Platanthera zijinensis TaxID=2320716 RepID=A0AAP0BP92_9ASPA